MSFRIPQRVRVENGRVSVPSIGGVRIRQSQAIELATRSATFQRTAVGRWFVTVVVKFEMPAVKVPIRAELRGCLPQGRSVGWAVHEACVAAICLEHGVPELWTADRDFSRIARIAVRNPQTAMD